MSDPIKEQAEKAKFKQEAVFLLNQGTHSQIQDILFNKHKLQQSLKAAQDEIKDVHCYITNGCNVYKDESYPLIERVHDLALQIDTQESYEDKIKHLEAQNLMFTEALKESCDELESLAEHLCLSHESTTLKLVQRSKAALLPKE